jgi:O-antigen ligase
LVERVLDPTHFQKSDSLIARMEMQLYGFDIGMEHGLLGVGYGCYGVLYEATAKGRYVEQARWMLASSEHTAYGLGDIGGHNTYLEIWVEQGLVGIVLTAGAIASLAIGLARKNASLRRGSLDRSLGLCCEAGLLAVLLSTVVIHMQEAPMPWMWLGLACAWLRLPSDGGDAA